MNRKIKKYRYDIAIILILILFLAISFFDWNIGGILSSRESLQNFVESFGSIGPLIMIMVIVSEVVFAPIPGYIPAVTSGFVFGPIWGAVYVYLGNIIGTILVFFLSRRYGRYIATKLFKEKKLKKYEQAIERHENWLLVFYFIPIFPLDVLTAAFGLSDVKVKKFMIVMLLGYLVYSIGLSFFGDALAVIFL